ncbi:MAG: type II secretion system major pseudopilin GspG [Pirellulaceae bacterium]|nr:type II secretion system major pseudopilin GspG [Pirellulaceae bacterium]
MLLVNNRIAQGRQHESARSQALASERTVLETPPRVPFVATLELLSCLQVEPALPWVPRPSLGTRWWHSAKSVPLNAITLRGAKSHHRRRAFSLVELMAVMVILALLATATVLAVVGFSDTARATKAVTDISTLVKALDSFYTVNGRYPTNAEGLEILTQPGKGSSSGFLKKIPKDPWQNRYEYFSPGSKGPFEVISRGADKKEGGDKANRDISSESLDQE